MVWLRRLVSALRTDSIVSRRRVRGIGRAYCFGNSTNHIFLLSSRRFWVVLTSRCCLVLLSNLFTRMFTRLCLRRRAVRRHRLRLRFRRTHRRHSSQRGRRTTRTTLPVVLTTVLGCNTLSRLACPTRLARLTGTGPRANTAAWPSPSTSCVTGCRNVRPRQQMRTQNFQQ